MNTKYLILSLTFFVTFTVNGQNLNIDTYKPTTSDSSSIIRWQCKAGASTFYNDNYPLIIINGKTFSNCLLQNIFFDIDSSTIKSVQVLNPLNDSIKVFRKSGKNGVIIITTKDPIEWISLRQILNEKSEEVLCSKKEVVIKIDKAFLSSNEELYFQKKLIKNISVDNNGSVFYNGKKYTCVLSISVTKKSGT